MNNDFYCAIGIETNGLIREDGECPSVLHLAIVIDDYVSPIESLENLNLIIAPDHNDKIHFQSEYVENMHKDLEARINSFRKKGKSIIYVEEKLTGKTLTYCRKNLAKKLVCDFVMDIYKNHGQITLAGKNPDCFDLIALDSEGILNRRMISDGKQVFNHRVMEVGSMYLSNEFKKPPSLGQILKLIGEERDPNEKFHHHALLDAYDIIKAVRAKMR